MFCIIYTYSNGILAIPWCVGILALVAGLIFLRYPINLRLKIFLFLIGVLALALFAPSMQQNKIETTPESFYLRTGLWWSPHVHQFLLRDVTKMEIIHLQDAKGRPRAFMRLTFRNGSTDDVPMGDLFRLHQDAILSQVSDAIERTNNTGLNNVTDKK